MKQTNFSPIIYDFFSITISSFLIVNFTNNVKIFEIISINLLILIILTGSNFYKFSRKISLKKKIVTLIIVSSVTSFIKILYFGYSLYINKFIYFDLNLLILLLLPRFFLNINEFKINFVKNYSKTKKDILVIGGLGYIGSHLVNRLLKDGKNVSVLDCCMYGKNTLKKFNNYQNFKFLEGYASDVVKLSKLMKDSSKVVHLAGLVGDPACALNEKDTKYFNIKTTNIIKNLCHDFEIEKFIFASSCSVYGNNRELCNEKTSPNPVSLYAATKRDSELELLDTKTDTKILRFSTIFGPSERLRFDLVVNIFIAQAFFNKKITVFGGDQSRPFLHVADAANSIYNFLNLNNRNSQEIYNIGFDELNFDIKDIAEIVKSRLNNGTLIDYSDDIPDKRNYRVSFLKYNNLFHNLKRYNINDGIDQFLDLFKSKKIDYKDSIYSNMLTTKKFIENQSNEIYSLNSFLND